MNSPSLSASPFRPINAHRHGGEGVQSESCPERDCYSIPVREPHFSVERRNDRVGRGLRITQTDLPFVGASTTETEIQVIDTVMTREPVVMFSVKHAHSGLWGRQTVVHKNILLACALAGVQSPLEIPKASIRLFQQVENPQNLHNYMERVMLFFRTDYVAEGISLFWWRAVGSGVVVVQNRVSGKVIFVPNFEKSVPSAVQALLQTINRLRHLPDSFFEIDPGYATEPSASSLPQEDFDGNKSPKDDEELSDEAITNLVRQWALDDGVSPWATNLVIRLDKPTKTVVNIRYSIGTDPQDPSSLSIQVHRNEPLSRELKAFPICMMQVVPKSRRHGSIVLAYRQAFFFRQKVVRFPPSKRRIDA